MAALLLFSAGRILAQAVNKPGLLSFRRTARRSPLPPRPGASHKPNARRMKVESKSKNPAGSPAILNEAKEKAAPRPYKPMSWPMRLVLAFVAANALAAAASLMLFPADSGAGFFWELTPPISAAMFGALYLVSGLLVARAALVGLWEPARFLAPMVVAFSAAMLLATFLHLDRFDGGEKLLYWLAVYAVALIAGISFYYRHERGGASWKVAGRRTTPAARSAALATGVLAAAFVAVGYASPGLVAGLWPWELTPLTTRAFLSWVGAFAVGLLWVAYDPDRGRTRPVAHMLAVTAALLGAMLLLHRQDLGPEPVGAWLFGAGVAGIGLLGAHMLLSGGDRKTGGTAHE